MLGAFLALGFAATISGGTIIARRGVLRISSRFITSISIFTGPPFFLLIVCIVGDIFRFGQFSWQSFLFFALSGSGSLACLLILSIGGAGGWFWRFYCRYGYAEQLVCPEALTGPGNYAVLLRSEWLYLSSGCHCLGRRYWLEANLADIIRNYHEQFRSYRGWFAHQKQTGG